MKYLALDFETGNASPLSACSIGLALFENQTLRYRRVHLIRPPDEVGPFHWGNVKIHGIRRAQLTNEPTFDLLWQQMAADFEGSMVVCHNASFDTVVLKKLLEYYHLPLPRCRFLCTVKVSQKVWPEMPNHKLDTVSDELQIALNHHEAGSDAYAAGLILQRALEATDAEDADGLAEKIGMRLGVIAPDTWLGCSTAAEVAKERDRAAKPHRYHRGYAAAAASNKRRKEEII